jgi:hypothetical protein
MMALFRCVGGTLALMVILTGCGQKQEAPPAPAQSTVTESLPAPTPPAAAPVVPPAPAAPTSVVDLVASAKAGVDQAMVLAKEGKYTEALSLLQQKATEVQANPEAKKLIDDAIAQIKQMATDAATKAATDKMGGMLGGAGK